jgi:hypothetical protein
LIRPVFISATLLHVTFAAPSVPTSLPRWPPPPPTPCSDMRPIVASQPRFSAMANSTIGDGEGNHSQHQPLPNPLGCMHGPQRQPPKPHMGICHAPCNMTPTCTFLFQQSLSATEPSLARNRRPTSYSHASITLPMRRHGFYTPTSLLMRGTALSRFFLLFMCHHWERESNNISGANYHVLSLDSWSRGPGPALLYL